MAHFSNGVSVLGRILERGTKNSAHLQNGVSILGEFVFRTGCQFGVPGGTYLPKKYPSAPPGFYSRQPLLQKLIPNSEVFLKTLPLKTADWRKSVAMYKKPVPRNLLRVMYQITRHLPCALFLYRMWHDSQFFLGKNSPRKYIYMQVTCYRPSSTRPPLQNSVLKNHGFSIDECIFITVFREASQANTFINCNQLKHVMPQYNGF